MAGRSNLVAFLVVGLLIGALAGYLTRPESAQIKLGPLTSSQIQHIALITLVGGVVGLGLGFATGRNKG